MAKKRKRDYTYYLEPSGDVAFTNKVLSKNIGEENFMEDVLCKDGRKYNLWRCLSGLVFMLWKSKESLKINFKIFCQEGNGQIRNITKWYASRHKPKRETSHAKF